MLLLFKSSEVVSGVFKTSMVKPAVPMISPHLGYIYRGVFRLKRRT
jgi:hypothetical protein